MTDTQSRAEMIVDPARANLPLAIEKNRRRVRFVAPKLLKFLGRIPFAEDLAAAYFCALDPVTPSRVKGVLMAALGYFVVPTDILPDFLIALGFTDDATVLAAALGVVGAHVKPRHQRAARRLLDRPEPPADVDH